MDPAEELRRGREDIGTVLGKRFEELEKNIAASVVSEESAKAYGDKLSDLNLKLENIASSTLGYQDKIARSTAAKYEFINEVSKLANSGHQRDFLTAIEKVAAIDGDAYQIQRGSSVVGEPSMIRQSTKTTVRGPLRAANAANETVIYKANISDFELVDGVLKAKPGTIPADAGNVLPIPVWGISDDIDGALAAAAGKYWDDAENLVAEGGQNFVTLERPQKKTTSRYEIALGDYNDHYSQRFAEVFAPGERGGSTLQTVSGAPRQIIPNPDSELKWFTDERVVGKALSQLLDIPEDIKYIEWWDGKKLDRPIKKSDAIKESVKRLGEGTEGRLSSSEFEALWKQETVRYTQEQLVKKAGEIIELSSDSPALLQKLRVSLATKGRPLEVSLKSLNEEMVSFVKMRAGIVDEIDSRIERLGGATGKGTILGGQHAQRWEHIGGMGRKTEADLGSILLKQRDVTRPWPTQLSNRQVELVADYMNVDPGDLHNAVAEASVRWEQVSRAPGEQELAIRARGEQLGLDFPGQPYLHKAFGVSTRQFEVLAEAQLLQPKGTVAGKAAHHDVKNSLKWLSRDQLESLRERISTARIDQGRKVQALKDIDNQIGKMKPGAGPDMNLGPNNEIVEMVVSKLPGDEGLYFQAIDAKSAEVMKGARLMNQSVPDLYAHAIMKEMTEQTATDARRLTIAGSRYEPGQIHTDEFSEEVTKVISEVTGAKPTEGHTPVWYDETLSPLDPAEQIAQRTGAKASDIKAIQELHKDKLRDESIRKLSGQVQEEGPETLIQMMDPVEKSLPGRVEVATEAGVGPSEFAEVVSSI